MRNLKKQVSCFEFIVKKIKLNSKTNQIVEDYEYDLKRTSVDGGFVLFLETQYFH